MMKQAKQPVMQRITSLADRLRQSRVSRWPSSHLSAGRSGVNRLVDEQIGLSALNRMLHSRFRLSTKLYSAIGGAVMLTMAASLVGWFSFNRVDDAQAQVNAKSIPEMAAAFEIAEYNGSLVAAAPRLTAAETPEDLNRIYNAIAAAHESLESQLDFLVQSGAGDEGFKDIRSRSQLLIANVQAIRNHKLELLELAEQREEVKKDLAKIRELLDDTLVPSIDSQLFYTITGHRGLDEISDGFSVHFSEDEFNRYRYLTELQSDANIATEILANVFTLSDPSFVEPLQERFEATISRIERNLAALEGAPNHDEVEAVFDQLAEFNVGVDSEFNLLERELRLLESQRELLASNQDEAVALIREVDGLVVVARDNAEGATAASIQAILEGRMLLLAISAMSIGGAFLIAWLFVGRVFLNRIEMLSEWMRRMAGGDLDARVEIGGNDEVTDMAAALEVFRQHALEIQRLNLVEELADELLGKNEELEMVLTDLRQAQDQIVAQQKLAALGELTAGVAHEIRNPLNFVKNFSESSQELLEELRDTINENADGLSDDQQSLIQDITDDLNANFERILSHGDRANRIVQDMLMMSRGAGEFRSIDINTLLEEHARLAYHSARATDPNFNVDLQNDLDPEAGEIYAIPQDLGRVFLNMVTNACYATNEKRSALADSNGSAESYFPTLVVGTRRDGEQVVVKIRDNGPGVPDEVLEKMFNPFFTTKPTDQGTGLGLAISSDIIRQHGGSIRVDTEPGEFTEMIIELPITPPAVPGDGETEIPEEAAVVAVSGSVSS